jgi:predicted Zn-dependent peptidase
VLETLASKGPTESEMKRAKEYYLGRRAMDLQSDSSLASYYGLEVLYRDRIPSNDEIFKNINRVTAKDVQRVCRKYLVEPHMVTSIVG